MPSGKLKIQWVTLDILTNIVAVILGVFKKKIYKYEHI